MQIVEFPDQSLRQVCAPCEPGDPELKKLAREMARDMYANNGCGLAAPQVGVLKRIIVIDCDPNSRQDNPIVLVNPQIEELKGDWEVEEEGCLSCPGITVPIKRRAWARVSYVDLDGKPQSIEGDGLLGRCLQHEIDHLNGKTLFDSCSPLDRLRAIQEYKIAQAMGAKPGETSVAPRVR